jgi:Lung seven transmembrane receptor
VTLGYGVVRPSLGSQMDKVLGIGASYFFLSLYYTIMASYPSRNKNTKELGYTLLSIVMFFLAGVDTAFYCWVFLSINNILQGLAARKKANKYLLYRNFRNVLVVSLFTNCVWLLYGSVIKLNTNVGEDRNWRDRWTVDALWEVTYFMVFVAIAILWAPSINLQQEGYFDVSQLEDDEEYQTGGVEMAESEPTDQHKDPDDAEYGGSLNDEVGEICRGIILLAIHSTALMYLFILIFPCGLCPVPLLKCVFSSNSAMM